MDSVDNATSKVQSFFSGVGVFFIFLLFSFVAALFAYSKFPDNIEFIISCGVLCGIIVAFTYSNFKSFDNYKITESLSKNEINHWISKTQQNKIIIGFMIIFLGVAASIQANQAINVAKESQKNIVSDNMIERVSISDRKISDMRLTYSLLNDVIGELRKTIPDNAEIKSGVQIITQINNLLKEIDEEIARNDKVRAELIDYEKSISANQGDVTQLFLFDFFSNIIIRLGSIGVTLLLFGVALAQYRRCDKRIEELRHFSLLTELSTSDGFDLEKIEKLRKALKIYDEPIKIKAGSLETSFANQIDESFAKFKDLWPKVGNSNSNDEMNKSE